MKLATGIALVLGLVGGATGAGALHQRVDYLRALPITAAQITSKDTRTAVEIRRDLERKP